MTTTFTAKHPTEAIFYGIDFSSLMATGETVSSASVTLRPLTFDDGSSAAMISGSAIITSNVVAQKIIAGLDGNTYRVAFSVVTSAGQTLVETADLEVIDRD